MNSIFIFILFIVGSIIFEGIKQSGNKQKQTAMGPKTNKPVVQPTVAPHKNPDGQNISRPQETRLKPQTKVVPRKAEEVFNVIDPEGVQTEGPIGEASLKSNKLDAEPAREQGFMDIDINDLQRSVVMTEILGKPKALKKN